MKAHILFLLWATFASPVHAQSTWPGYSNQSDLLCSGGALYAPINRRIGTFPNQQECLKAARNSKWGLVCAGGGLLINIHGRVVDNYFDQDLCVTSLRYSSFAPSRICSGRILKNLEGGVVTTYSTAEECLEAQGKPPG